MRFSNPAFIKYIETSGNEYLITPQAENLFKGNPGQVWSRGEGKLPCIGETKGTLCERFKEHRQATNNPLHANATAAVPSHFNQPGHSISAMDLIPLELQHTLSMARLKAREAYLIDRGKTLSPDVLNRKNEHWTVSISIL